MEVVDPGTPVKSQAVGFTSEASFAPLEARCILEVELWKNSFVQEFESDSLMHPDEILERFAELNFEDFTPFDDLDMKLVHSFLWMVNILPDLDVHDSSCLDPSSNTFMPDANVSLLDAYNHAEASSEALQLALGSVPSCPFFLCSLSISKSRAVL